jgi:hypothetical protein
MRRLNREPIISPGGLSRLAVVLITLTVGGLLSRGVHRVLHPKNPWLRRKSVNSRPIAF